MITSVKAQNFLSFRNLEFNLKAGVTLVDGWNEDDQTSEGSGKSAIFNAICWAIFGKIPKDANIDDVIKEGEKTCGVEVFFGADSIRRSRGPNELVLTINGKNIKGKDAKETQTIIEEYVGLTFETFCQTIYFAQNYTKKFITANQEDKGKILSEVQDLTLFDRASKEVKALISQNEKDVEKLKHSRDLATKDEELVKRDIEAEQLKYKLVLQQQDQKIKNIESQIESHRVSQQHALDQQAQRVQNINMQIIDAEKMAREYETTKARHLETASSMVYDESLEKSFRETNNQLMAESGAITAEISGIEKLVSKRNTAETQGKRYAARYKQLQAEKEKNLAFIANPSQSCPTCGTQLEACDTSHAHSDVARIDQEVIEITDALTMLAAEIDAPIPTAAYLSAKLQSIRQQVALNDAEIAKSRGIKDTLNKIAATLTSLDQNIKSTRDRVSKLKTAAELESRPLILDLTSIESLQLQLEEAKKPLVFDTSILESLQIKLGNTQSNIQDLIRLTSEKQSHINRLEDLKNGFKEIKSYVFNSMLNEINARVQKYLTHLFEVPVSVRFKNEDMKIETDVKFDGNERGLGLLSGGQFRRASLAVDLALSDVITSRKGSKVGVLILDEYFKDLSESSMEKCLTLLEGRGQPVLLIEHNSLFKNIVNNSVTVRLENGTSHVEV